LLKQQSGGIYTMDDLRLLLPSVSEAMDPILRKMDLDLERESHVIAGDLESSGQQLIWVAGNLWWQLSEAQHSVLPATLRDAGIGLLDRSSEMRHRATTEEDVHFYSEVRSVLAYILSTIRTGDYAQELERIRAAKERP
jgi:hypothetical protein